jgi:hypothetical protein
MAVFLAAGDESDGPQQRGPFIYGGFISPVRDWIDTFTPTWERLVLNAYPPIPYLHMVDIRSPKWRQRYGLNKTEADLRVDAAATIIGSRSKERFCPLKTEFDGGHFRDVFGETKLIRFGRQTSTYRMEPDYVGFLGFAYGALEYVWSQHPTAEKVDFVIERKTTITQHIEEFSDTLANAFRAKGRPELIRLIGDLIPGGKERVPLQAADVAVWHLRRNACKEADDDDIRRLSWMFDGRPMMTNGMTLEEIHLMGTRSKAHAVPNPLHQKARSGGDAA